MKILVRIIDFGRAHFGQLWRFAAVGGVTFGINFAIFSLFYGVFHLDYRIAVSFAYVVTVCSHFLLHKVFTFGAHAQKIRHTAPRYGVMLGLNYAITLLASWITVDVVGASPYFAVVAATVGTAVSSFLVMKFFVFRTPERMLAAKTCKNDRRESLPV